MGYINITGFIDSNPQKQKDGYLSCSVYSVQKFQKIKTDDVTVIVSIGSEAEKSKIIKQMEEQCGLKHKENLFDIREFLDELPDDEYLRIVYRKYIKKELNLENPQTFNEKLQWLKLYDRKSEYTMMADKYEVRKYIADKIGEEYLIPLIGVWDKFADIDFDQLPSQFVLKCNRDSGSVVVCKDKNTYDFESAKFKLVKAFNYNYFYNFREWPYKNIIPKIIAEEYLYDLSGEINDYKLYCYNGKVKCTNVNSGRNSKSGVKYTFFDNDWNRLPFKCIYENDERNISKPQYFEMMTNLAEKLAANVPFLRVDFFEINKKLYIVELTFYCEGGFGKFEPDLYDEMLGSWLILPKKNLIAHKKG